MISTSIGFLADVSQWMSDPKLKLNLSDTELCFLPGKTCPIHDLSLSLCLVGNRKAPACNWKKTGSTYKHLVEAWSTACACIFRLPMFSHCTVLLNTVDTCFRTPVLIVAYSTSRTLSNPTSKPVHFKIHLARPSLKAGSATAQQDHKGLLSSFHRSVWAMHLHQYSRNSSHLPLEDWDLFHALWPILKPKFDVLRDSCNIWIVSTRWNVHTVSCFGIKVSAKLIVICIQ